MSIAPDAASLCVVKVKKVPMSFADAAAVASLCDFPVLIQLTKRRMNVLSRVGLPLNHVHPQLYH